MLISPALKILMVLKPAPIMPRSTLMSLIALSCTGTGAWRAYDGNAKVHGIDLKIPLPAAPSQDRM